MSKNVHNIQLPEKEFSSPPTFTGAGSALLSPRELAEALGVSESSIKRWTDDGRIRATRTAGGHRRIVLSEAIRFVRESRVEVVKPEYLGLCELAKSATRAATLQHATELFHGYLHAGAASEARSLVQSLYLSGRKIAEIVDGPIQEAMRRLGELWHDSPAGIFREHRATDLCIQALDQLRLLQPSDETAPVAVGAAPAGDPYFLPSLAAATVLEAEGYRAVNLGPETPLDTLLRATHELRPRLVWLSVSVTREPETLRVAILRLGAQLCEQRVPLLVGGRELLRLDLGTSPHLTTGSTMAELAALARGLALAGG